jgi:uncharacterized protein (TIGR03118 family)
MFLPVKVLRFILLLAALLLLAGLISCGGGYGNSRDAARRPSLTFKVEPTLVRAGESAELSWAATAGAECAATGGWSGAEPATGTLQVTPATPGRVIYTLTCSVPAGSGHAYGGTPAMKSVTLDVTPADAFSATDLAADTASALVLDSRLVNPWGVAFAANTTAWVANSGTNTATLYDGNGHSQPLANPLTIALPTAVDGLSFAPTGIVFNGSADFVVHGESSAAPAKFIFAGRNGSLAGWVPTVDRENAIRLYDDPESAYTGLAIAEIGLDNFLYAADFLNRRVDVFDTNFTRQVSSAMEFTFEDADLPAGYAPFGIQTLATGANNAPQVFVSYAMQSPADDRQSLAGAGLGLVDVYDTNGRLLRRLIGPGAALDAPWGMALAPDDFGALGNRLLIGNVGDGRINAYGATTGQFSTTLSDARRVPFAVPGLRGLAFGNDVNNQPHNTLFYAAGTNGEANGAFGRIDVGATPPLLNQPPVITIAAPAAGDISGVVTLTATVQSSIPINRVEYYADEVFLGTVTAAPYSFEWDTAAFPDGVVFLIADAFDTDGNAGISMLVAVNIVNGSCSCAGHDAAPGSISPVRVVQ